MTALPSALVRYGHDLERAIERDLARRRSARRRALALRVAGVAAAAALAVGAIGTLGGDDVPGVERASAALAIPERSILHIRMVGSQDNGDGTTVGWQSESWQRTSAPYARRQIETGPDGRRVETAALDGVDYVYDAGQNTIYVAPPAPAEFEKTFKTTGKPTFRPGPRPGTVVVDVRTAGGEIRRVVMEEKELERQPDVAAAVFAADLPFRQQVLALLESRDVREAGRVTLDGREAIRFVSADGDATYLVDADTYDPIEWTTRGEGGSSTLRFTAYERLPLNDATEKLTDLTAQHPDARVVKDPAEYAAAQARLFPKG